MKKTYPLLIVKPLFNQEKWKKELKMMRQKPISIKIPDQILILIDNFVRLGQYESRSHFLRVAIEEMLKQETGTWEKLVDQISGKK